MEIKQAIEILKRNKPTSDPRRCGKELCEACDVAISAMQELQEYKKIGTLEEVREAVEKQKPIAPTYEGDGYAPDGTFVWDEWICPNCGTRYEVDYDDYDYCPKCGQRILWEDIDGLFS